METNVVSVEMANELYVAAIEGNVVFLDDKSNEYLLRKTPKNNNILHIAAQCEKIEIIKAVLTRFPNNRDLLRGENSQRNTPLHIAGETGNIEVVKVLYEHYYLLDAKMVDGVADEKLWMRMKNLKGNTAAHEAIIHGNVEIAMFLLNTDPGLACIRNESQEAPLHLAVKNPTSFSMKTSTKASIQRELKKRSAATSLVPAEDMTSIITLLVKQAGYVTGWPDGNGFTPLHRAASLSAPYHLEIIKFIIERWPLSAEVCDKSGNSILHLLIDRIPSYREAKKLLRMKELYTLRNCQDRQGNTPLHLAALKMDIVMVRTLLESGANSDIINMEGLDAASLIQQQNIIQKLKTQSMSEEEREAADKGDIAFLKERLTNFGVDFLHSQDSSNGQNLLHKLFKLPIKVPQDILEEVKDDPYYDFIKQVMSSYPPLVCQTDFNGDTPIHVLVRNNVNGRVDSLIATRLELCNTFIKEMEEDATSNNNEAPSYHPPWVVQNVHGNTPLHQALIAADNWRDNYHVVSKLMEYNIRPIDLCNKRGETLYHLLKDNFHEHHII